MTKKNNLHTKNSRAIFYVDELSRIYTLNQFNEEHISKINKFTV